MVSMPIETAKSGLFTFGTGIMVGLGAAFAMRATLPRATEIVGLMMQKMGFELGDILLALWDPEAQQAALAAPAPTLAAPKKKRAEGTRSKSVHRNGKAPILQLPRHRRGDASRSNGKAPKLSSTRRVVRSGLAVRLN
jgi:hypothetical protein